MQILNNNKLKTKSKSFNSSLSTAKGAKTNRKKSVIGALLKRVVITNTLSLIIVALTYFWMVYFLSNVSSFWDLFRDKEIYVREDTVAPMSPFLNAIPRATQEESIDITGRAIPGARVVLYVDDATSDQTTTDSEGVFAFPSVPITIFQQKIYVKAVDENGVESRPSTEYSVIRDTEPPELEIITPVNGEEFRSTGQSYRVTGTTEPDATVYVNDQLAVVNPSGEFFTSVRLEIGGNNLQIRAIDRAGNETEEFVNIQYEKID